MKGILRTLRRLSRRLYVRIALVASLAIIALLIAQIVGGYIGESLVEEIGTDAVHRLLDIIATSMLTVTTFSLTVMVSVFRSSSQQFTPRTHRELMKDTRTQTALATFIGAYIYALIAIVLSERPGFTKADEAALYLTTLLVLALIVGQMIRWMIHLQSVGSLLHVGAGIEREAIRATEARSGDFWERLGAPPDHIPQGRRICAEECAYVQALNPEPLIEAAEEAGARVHLAVGPGSFIDVGDVLAVVEGGGGEELDQAVRDALHLGVLRTTEQDPRFGLILLSELGSKALSPGINDPGTAIDVLGRIARVLECWRPCAPAEGAVVTAPRIEAETLVVNAFEAIARDGAGLAEVQIFLQKRLAALGRSADPGLAAAARACAARAMERVRREIDDPFDVARVEAAAAVRE
ncbi:hypothetical protein GCM10011392_20440 [Wenxinia marina]|uniref:DUF2254 domain-containing protein n=1 Tax=Wenxinia marina TaxID=390641 RepID=UPI0003698017|nr:DUF2254 domain-containing protein [Wenxinia marina]GGL65625.1 hypothetical protein GCM10011392_20440 [Wenxinia marina]